ncbi:MAG: permease prefix domain 1-containing protein [Clostridiales bacterium]|jgi:magnesium-transporting ATPase (P-type)|nr:permease prefix domain 1-containing protein [Clostridiales bacterium]
MREEFQKYLDKKFNNYRKSKALNDFKEEILCDLTERYAEFKEQGFSDSESYDKSIASLGDYTDALRTLDAHTPRKTKVTFSKLMLSVSALYFTLLLIAYAAASFLSEQWKSTWLILMVGVLVYAVVMFVLGYKNAFANQKSGRMRFNALMIFFAVFILSYFTVSFVTGLWAKTWLLPISIFALWFTVDVMLAKSKRKGKRLAVRTDFMIMIWAVTAYLVVSTLIGGNIWSYSWLIILLGIAVMFTSHVVYYIKKYSAEIKSGKDGNINTGNGQN